MPLMEPQRKGVGTDLVVPAIVNCLLWAIIDTSSRIADRCRCRAAYRGAAQTNFQFAAAGAAAVIDAECIVKHQPHFAAAK